jgi:hypothetical protein
MSNQSYSLLIPHVFMNISDEKLIHSFEKYNLGKIAKIDSVMKTSREGYKYRMVFVHFEYWNMNNTVAVSLKNKIENPNKEARLVYDDPWYWLLLPGNRKTEAVSREFNTMKNFFESKFKQIEREVNCIYEELYGREYMYNGNKTPEWDVNSNANLKNSMQEALVQVDDKSDNETDVSTLSTIDDSIYTTDIDNDSNYIDYKEYVYDRFLTKNKSKLQNKDRVWMTKNICDNL